MKNYKYGEDVIEEIQSFKWFCRTRLGYSKLKWFHQSRWYMKKMGSEIENPTFVNEKTQLLWRMWKSMHREVWENYDPVSNNAD